MKKRYTNYCRKPFPEQALRRFKKMMMKKRSLGKQRKQINIWLIPK